MIDARDANDQFNPTDLEDGRRQVVCAIKERRGQAGFRHDLIAAYYGCAAVTGCAALDVLEDAHIHPYLGTETNHSSNGLLLRVDLHIVFNGGLVSIVSDGGDGLRFVVAPALRGLEYGALDSRPLRPRVPGAVPLRSARDMPSIVVGLRLSRLEHYAASACMRNLEITARYKVGATLAGF